MFLILQFSWLEKERKKQFKNLKATPLRLLISLVFSNPPTIPTPPPPNY